jgi:hypothetical protein
MPTDNDLVTLLRHGFERATEDLDPEPGILHVVRRRHVRARRRRLVVGAAIPAAALAASTGFALAGRDIPNHIAVPRPGAPTRSISASTTTPLQSHTTSAQVKPASYKVVLTGQSAPPNCPANATAPVGKSDDPAALWYWTEDGTCVFVGVGWADTKPANAAPFRLEGYPGLYDTLKDRVRTIYAPVAPGTIDAHPSGGWIVLTVPATASQEMVVRLIVPAN